jgi:hypothetical protein
MLGGQAGIGERHLGDGVIRIVGAMFPNPSFLPDETRDMRFGLQSYALSFSAWQIFLNLVDYERPETATNQADLVVAHVATASKVGEGDNALIRATVVNQGGGDAAASLTGFVLDGETVLGSVDTPLIRAGDSAEVSLNWPTGGIKGEHTISVTADATGVLDEVDEANNLGLLTVNVKGNKVTNGSFEQANSAGNGPEGWEGDSTGAGTSSWSDGGSDGERSVSISGTGRSAVLHGAPSWTSAPISVNAGELLSLSVDVRSQGLSSAPGVGLAYLGPAGELLNTVNLLNLPRLTDGFASLEQVVTIPSGVTEVRIVLYGFNATDLRTSGTVTFDNVVLAEH